MYQTSFDIISTPKNLFIKTVSIITAIAMVVAMGFAITGSFLQGYRLVYKICVGISLSSFVTGALILNIYAFTRKRQKKIGTIVFSEEAVSFELDNEREEILIKEVLGCAFSIMGYHGESASGRSMAFYKGNNNYVEILTKTRNYKFEFYIPDALKMRGLELMVSKWKKAGAIVSIDFQGK